MNSDLNGLNQPKILIVDDTPDNLRVLSGLLSKQGYNIRKALNGEIALNACKKVIPDLILLDIRMPGLDGYEVCKRLKIDDKTRHIPVIFISALDDIVDKVKAFDMGGADYITKPFQAEEVIARITHQLTIQQLHRQLATKNEQLQQLNEALTRSNTDLEQFAYVVAHDLRTPLQAIVMLAELIDFKYQTSLNSEGRGYLERIVKAGLRMKQMIENLLAFSRVESSLLELEPINSQSVLEEALVNLQEQISNSQAAILYSDLPIVLADSTQLMQLYQNLISNAIKFSRPGISPKIEISAIAVEGNQWQFQVQDNGIGIEPKYFDRIFKIFQRLHTYQEYPGTGIGMAICKKIVESHGGRIWVDSEVGLGTTFYFTLSSP